MTPIIRLLRLAPLACMLMTASCAASPLKVAVSTVAPPRLTLPDIATAPCGLATLPARPDQADLEVAYMTRGAQIVACDGARRVAVETLLAERSMQDRWRAALQPKRRRFWPW